MYFKTFNGKSHFVINMSWTCVTLIWTRPLKFGLDFVSA